MQLPKILFIGRPNVGKSTLINRLLKKRAAISYETPGLTRDINEYLITHEDKSFLLLDSGGLIRDKSDLYEFQNMVENLVENVLSSVSKIVFLTDAQDGLLPGDKKIAQLLRSVASEKVILVANKADNDNIKHQVHEFYQLSFGKPLPVSATLGTGVQELLDRITEGFLTSDIKKEELEQRFKIAIAGRPNVGKSSLINSLVKSDQVIVSEKSGTTRDAIHLFFKHQNQLYEFIDTAGIRRQTKMKGRVEFFSVVRAKDAIEECDLVLFVIDADRGFSHQDKRIAQDIIDAGKSMIIFVNKIDCLADGEFSQKDWAVMLVSSMPTLEPYPIIFGSCKTKVGIQGIFKTIPPLFEKIHDRISTSQLNQFNQEIIKRYPAPSKFGKRVNIYYITQVETLPPTFVCFVNNIKYLTNDYKRFLEKRIRSYLGGFKGHTLKLLFKNRQREALADLLKRG